MRVLPGPLLEPLAVERFLSIGASKARGAWVIWGVEIDPNTLKFGDKRFEFDFYIKVFHSKATACESESPLDQTANLRPGIVKFFSPRFFSR